MAPAPACGKQEEPALRPSCVRNVFGKSETLCCVAGYALSPIDLILDFVPVLGYLDDLIIVPLGILIVVKLIPPEIIAEHRALAAAAQGRPVSHTAAIVIVVVWAASIVVAAWLCYRAFAS